MNDNTLDFRGNTPSIDPNNPENSVFLRQLRIASLFRGSATGMLTIMGPCAMTEDLETLVRESVKIHQFEEMNPGVTALHRLPFHKPRSNPFDWHGLITTNPKLVAEIMEFKSIFFGDIAVEIGSEEHLEDFEKEIAMIWLGSRNFGNKKLAEFALRKNIWLPVGIKNDMSGDTESMMDLVKHLKEKFPSSTPIPVMRGGFGIENSFKWGETVKELSELTQGNFILDTAHGSEMAHDPSGNFGKGVEAQIAALHHALELKQQGHNFKGLMVEMGDAISPTDPVIPHEIGMAIVQEIVDVK